MTVPAARSAGDEEGAGDRNAEMRAVRARHDEGHPSTRLDGPDEPCQPSDDESLSMEGFVYGPERYRECTNFHISVFSRRFWTSVGRGPTPCRRPPREFIGYGISYVNGDGVDGDRVDEEVDDERTDDEGDDPEYSSALLAVPTLGRDDFGLPHEYYVPGQRFRFVSADGEFVFQTACSDPPVPVQRGSFERVV